MKLSKLKMVPLVILLCFFQSILSGSAGSSIIISPPGSAEKPKQLIVNFLPFYHHTPLQLNKKFYEGKDSLSISALRFYISCIELRSKSKPVWQEFNSYHLIDMEEPSGMKVPLTVPSGLSYDHIIFTLGIDSLTNAGGAGGGVLDATKGMYWAWQSGYINLKIEGVHSACETRKHEFQFHLGGFRGNDYCAQPLHFAVKEYQTINIIADIATFTNSIDFKSQTSVMSPGSEAVELSKRAANMFSTKAGL